MNINSIGVTATAAQHEAIRRHVRGRVVCDLGCGAGFPWRDTLLDMGAKSVIGIDKEPPSRELIKALSTERWEYIQAPFERFRGNLDVAFLSWPINAPVPGLISLVASARTVIYLGKNTDGSACGTARLFRTLATRRVIAHEPHPRNTLIVYGRTTQKSRNLLLEEEAGMHPDVMYKFVEGR